MGEIRVFSGVPKAFEFSKEDILIDNRSGNLYYKDWKGNVQTIVKSTAPQLDLTVKSLLSNAILVKGNITASGDISASGTIIANTFQSDQDTISIEDSVDITGSIKTDGFVSAMGIGTPSNITSDVTIPPNINAIQLTDNTGDLTISSSINYTVGLGATTRTPFLLDAKGGGAYMTGELIVKGNISSSGELFADTGSFSIIEGGVF